MKTRRFCSVFIALFAGLIMMSCQHEEPYDSGTYLLSYRLVNSTPNAMTLHVYTWTRHKPKETTLVMQPNDTTLLYQGILKWSARDLSHLTIPTVEAGYNTYIEAGDATWIDYQGKTYIVDYLEGSFYDAKAYAGTQGKSELMFDYYFTLTEDYILSLPIQNQ
ncbi:MAG: hypothetical protein MJZ82_01070 [Paludibacteraceae bacterium]|nr:hypothetical protein [Paludibacteraceae bacterium]